MVRLQEAEGSVWPCWMLLPPTFLFYLAYFRKLLELFGCVENALGISRYSFGRDHRLSPDPGIETKLLTIPSLSLPIRMPFLKPGFVFSSDWESAT